MPEGDYLGGQDLYQLVACRKILYLPFPDWEQKPTNSRFWTRSIEVYDESYVTIPGMLVCLESRTGRIPGECKDLYTLFQQRPWGDWERLFQIEVVPGDKRSHNGPDGEVYGPHLHYGHDPSSHQVRQIASVLSCAVDDRRGWFRRFQRHVNISLETANGAGQLSFWDLEI